MVLAAIGQITSTASFTHNLSQCISLLSRAATLNVKALFLPEASDYIASSPTETLSLCQPIESSPFVLGLQDAVKRYKVPVHVGIHEPGENGKIKNTLVWIDEEGIVKQRYQKVHLFDVNIEGGPVLKESAIVDRGNEMPKVFDTALGKIGPAICFDLRFPEIALALRHASAQIITYPSAFTIPTGRAHWSVLLRSRAIETQSYVIAAAQVGKHNDKRQSYGHGMIVDPWGEVLVELAGDGGEDLGVAEIDLGKVERIRREVPLARRWDLYPEI